MQDQKQQSDETVILVLGDKRVEAFREKLALKSLYFASLFSHNFSDSLLKEYAINYDITLSTLQDFVNWTTEDKACVLDNHHYVKPCMMKFVSSNYADLLQLLQLSVLLMAESLSQDLTDIIVRHWFSSKTLLEIWTLAEELSLTELRDVTKAECLERFQELPVESLMELPKKSFIELLGNVNIQASESYLLHLAHKWIQQNDMLSEKAEIFSCVSPLKWTSQDYGDMAQQEEMDDDFESRTLRRKPAYIQCVVGHKVIENNKKKACIYCWDGKKLFELVELKETMDPGKNIEGMQVVGRGFNIYMVGGEQGYGTGRFNKNIWRYCTLSKKWYFVSSLPVPRRHMAVAFLQENLMIMGGVGRYRFKLSTVDVFNTHTGEWTKAADVPEDTHSVPATCEMDGKLLLFKTALYMYDPAINVWDIVRLKRPLINTTDMKCIISNFITAFKNVIYISDSFEVERTRMWIIESIANPVPERVSEFQTLCNNQVENWPNLISFSYENGVASVEVGTVDTADYYAPLRLFTEKRDDIVDFCHDAPMGCFNIVHPKSLHQQFDPRHGRRKMDN